MALSITGSQSASAHQSQRQRLCPHLQMMLGLLGQPIGDLREAVRREVETNPAIDDVNFSPFYRRSVGAVSAGGVADALLSNLPSRGESLDEHLMGELRLSGLDGRDRELCEAVIAELDEQGRFRGSIPDMLMVHAGVSEADIERARKRVMGFDPLGCGAKDTRECLLAQLSRIPAADRDAVRQVVVRFDELLAGKLALGDIDASVLAVFRKYRGRLQVNPGERFAPKRVEVVTADISVDADGDVSVETADIPELPISTKYLSMAADRSLDAETRHYAQERIRHAKAFSLALQRRHDTLREIAELVIAFQPDLLNRGEAGLRRLTMTEVAKKAKCSVSTVSRAANRKYVKTPKGVLPLSKFFSLVEGAPLAKLRALLAANPGASDQKISQLMATVGHQMARRTVAKYRARFAGESLHRKENSRYGG